MNKNSSNKILSIITFWPFYLLYAVVSLFKGFIRLIVKYKIVIEIAFVLIGFKVMPMIIHSLPHLNELPALFTNKSFMAAYIGFSSPNPPKYEYVAGIIALPIFLALQYICIPVLAAQYVWGIFDALNTSSDEILDIADVHVDEFGNPDEKAKARKENKFDWDDVSSRLKEAEKKLSASFAKNKKYVVIGPVVSAISFVIAAAVVISAVVGANNINKSIDSQVSQEVASYENMVVVTRNSGRIYDSSSLEHDRETLGYFEKGDSFDCTPRGQVGGCYEVYTDSSHTQIGYIIDYKARLEWR